MLGRLSLAVLAAAALTGCPGEIEDPAPFYAAAGSACPSDIDVEVDILQGTCGALGCHRGGDGAAAGLDLRSEGFRERILAHTSTQCGDRPLLNPDDFQNSYLFLKMSDSPPCGDPMPARGGPLTPAERTCLEEYMAELAGVESGDGGAPSAVDAGPPAVTDAGGDPTDGGPAPTAITYEAESDDVTRTDYEVDASDPTVIRVPDGLPGGTAAVTFDGTPGTYTLTLHVQIEPDGEPTVRVFVAGTMVTEATYPLASGTEHEPYALAPVEVTLAAGDEIRVEGDADDEGTLPDGTTARDAWARIDRLELTP